eukprot:347376-Chlamydomonas_euryale.AAC.2
MLVLVADERDQLGVGVAAGRATEAGRQLRLPVPVGARVAERAAQLHLLWEPGVQVAGAHLRSVRRGRCGSAPAERKMGQVRASVGAKCVCEGGGAKDSFHGEGGHLRSARECTVHVCVCGVGAKGHVRKGFIGFGLGVDGRKRVVTGEETNCVNVCAVSYTHLTLPTILLV